MQHLSSRILSPARHLGELRLEVGDALLRALPQRSKLDLKLRHVFVHFAEQLCCVWLCAGRGQVTGDVLAYEKEREGGREREKQKEGERKAADAPDCSAHPPLSRVRADGSRFGRESVSPLPAKALPPGVPLPGARCSPLAPPRDRPRCSLAHCFLHSPRHPLRPCGSDWVAPPSRRVSAQRTVPSRCPLPGPLLVSRRLDSHRPHSSSIRVPRWSSASLVALHRRSAYPMKETC